MIFVIIIGLCLGKNIKNMAMALIEIGINDIKQNDM